MSLTGFLFGFLWWCVRWSFALLLFMGVMACAGYYVFKATASSGDYVTVPDIVDLPFTEAARVLRSQGLELGEWEYLNSSKPKDQVIAQRPPAGSVVKAGRKVFPTISGQSLDKAPNLVGKSLAEVEDLARAQGFKVVLSRIPTDKPADTVLSQDPLPGQKNVQGRNEIHILVSSGSSQMLMVPDLVGRRLEQVASILAPLGLEARTQAIEAPDQPLGIVLAQDPAAGTYTQKGAQVTIRTRAAEAKAEPAPTEVTYNAELVYNDIPFSWSERTVRFDVIDASGRRMSKPWIIEGGDTKGLRLKFTYAGRDATVEVFLDDQLVKSIKYRNGEVASE